MKQENDPLEIITKNLLKKSLVNMPNHDFSDQLMERIFVLAEKKKESSYSIVYAWIALIISTILIFYLLRNSFIPLNTSFIILHNFFSQNREIIMLAVISVIASFILFQVDNLVRITFQKKFSGI